MPVARESFNVGVKIVRIGGVRLIRFLFTRHETTLDTRSRVSETLATIVLDLLAPDSLLLLIAESIDSDLAFLFAVGPHSSLSRKHLNDRRLEGVTDFTGLDWLRGFGLDNLRLQPELKS